MSMLIIPSLQQAQSKGSVKHTHYGMALDCNWRYFKWLQSNHARGIAEVKVWGSLQQAPGMCHLGETQSCSVFSYRHSEQFWLRKTVNTSSRKISYSHLYTYTYIIYINTYINITWSKRGWEWETHIYEPFLAKYVVHHNYIHTFLIIFNICVK